MTDTANAPTLINIADNLTVINSSSADDLGDAAYSESYFDALYCDNTDPWQYQTRWYEQRKRDICLAVLPKANYQNAIELGCGNGVFSERLAQRCQLQISIDGNAQAVQLARQRLAAVPHIKVIQGIIPSVLSQLEQTILEAYPTFDASANASTEANANGKANTNCDDVNDTTFLQSTYDLIVISEILYYLSAADIDSVIAWSQEHLAAGGTLLCCHWRYAIDGFDMTGESVHERLQRAFLAANNAQNQSHFTHQSKLIDSDFLLDVWQKSPNSIAKQENLV